MGLHVVGDDEFGIFKALGADTIKQKV